MRITALRSKCPPHLTEDTRHTGAPERSSECSHSLALNVDVQGRSRNVWSDQQQVESGEGLPDRTTLTRGSSQTPPGHLKARG